MIKSTACSSRVSAPSTSSFGSTSGRIENDVAISRRVRGCESTPDRCMVNSVGIVLVGNVIGPVTHQNVDHFNSGGMALQRRTRQAPASRSAPICGRSNAINRLQRHCDERTRAGETTVLPWTLRASFGMASFLVMRGRIFVASRQSLE